MLDGMHSLNTVRGLSWVCTSLYAASTMSLDLEYVYKRSLIPRLLSKAWCLTKCHHV